MNRLVASFVLCFGALLATACGSTAAGGGSTVVTDTGSGSDTGLGEDVAAGTDASATDTAKSDTDMAMDTMPMGTDAMAMDTGPMDTGPAADVASGACTNPTDEAVNKSVDVAKKVGDCASSSLGNGAKAKPCIVTNTGFTDGCAQCFADTIDCVSKNCVFNGACIGGDSPTCDACRIKNCGPAFTTCSGWQS
jgi:hypothetical protein